MKLKLTLNLAVAALACAALAPRSTRAGGIDLYEIATPDVGLASAGYSARAQDPSTLFKNPAGMSLLPDTQIQGGLQLTYGNVAFSPGAGTSFNNLRYNDGGGNAVGALPAGSLFVTTEITDRIKAGFGTFSYFGLAEDYGDTWVGRYYVQKSTLLGMSLMPAVSWQVNDWLSLGGGANVMYGYLNSDVGINNLIGADGQLSLKDHAWGVGGIGGVLVEPRKGTRIGATYISQVNLSFADTPSFSNLGPGLQHLLSAPPNLDLGVTVPQSVMFGLYQELSPKWAIMGDVGWQNWKRFGQVEVGVETLGGVDRVVTKQLQFQDTWHGALGAQYRPWEPWRFSAGVAFDSTAEDSANRSVVLPLGQMWRFGLGAEWQAAKNLNLGAAYEFGWAGNMPVDQGIGNPLRGRVVGSYEGAYFSFFSLNLTYKF